MINLLQADLYRMLRGRALYITLALLLGFVTLVVCSSQAVNTGVSMPHLEASLQLRDSGGEDSRTGDNDENTQAAVYNGRNTALVLQNLMGNLVWYLLPLLLAAAAPIFTHKTVKNALSYGISGTKLYLSKLLLSSLLCVGAVGVYMAYGIGLATLLRGFGEASDSRFWMDLLQTLGAQLLPLLALNALGVLLVFAAKRSSMVIGFYVALGMLPLILLMILTGLNAEWVFLYDYELQGIVKKLSYLPALEPKEVTKSLTIAASHLLFYTLAGLIPARRL